MRKTLFAILAILAWAGMCASPVRQTITLLDGWGYKPITSSSKTAPLQSVMLPHTWNAQYPEGTTLYNREMMVYQRTLDITEQQMQDKRLFLYFEGVNSVADVFVNGHTAGNHKGGYTAFCFEITDMVHEGENQLEVWVSNAYRTDVLPLSGDFLVYGGIHRPCHLIVTEPNCISPLFYASPGVFIHQRNVSDKEADIEVETVLSLAEPKSGLSVRTTVSDRAGHVVVSLESPVAATKMKTSEGVHVMQPMKIISPELWDGKRNPALYNVTVELYDNGALLDRMEQRTGFRYFSVDADEGFFLNGQYLDLYGFCRHEDIEGKGSALLKEDYEHDMELILESGATAMRLAHYPHAEPMYDLSDENGIVLWTEIPLCGPGGYAYTGYLKSVEENAREVLRELVYQKYNHPSIIFWGIFNELQITNSIKKSAYDDPEPFVSELNSLYKSLDPVRLTAFATCVDQTSFLGRSDLIGWNKYFGWYSDAADAAGEFFDGVHATSNGQPVGVSEYGAGASIHHHQWPLDAANRHDGRFHPEEAQVYCHEGNWAAFSTRKWLWGKFIWNFADFQSYLRTEGDRDGINDKGLLTYDHKTRKDAFYFYKANWNPEPMVYISSRRYVDRTDPQTIVKVFCNMDEATLYVNGKKIGRATKDAMNRMVWENVELSKGDNEILVEARQGRLKLSDSCVWTLR